MERVVCVMPGGRVEDSPKGAWLERSMEEDEGWGRFATKGKDQEKRRDEDGRTAEDCMVTAVPGGQMGAGKDS